MTLLVALSLIAGTAGAQPAAGRAEPCEPAKPTAAEEAELAEAKALFAKGYALVRSGDFAKALRYYLESRAKVPSVHNTINAAICLAELGRFDESLEMYEEAITRFRDELTEEEHRKIASEMHQLRSRVGSVDVVANVPGRLVIDGRERGKLPLVTAVRVLPGEHTLHVMKEGFQTFEMPVTVRVGETTTVRCSLKPLLKAGWLRLEDAALEGAEIFIDGAPVGKVPWKGMVEPGRHIFQLRRGNEGTAPQQITIVKGQTVRGSASLRPLGPELHITATPPETTLSLGSVPLGKGRWQGRLPLGEQTLLLQAEGYHDESRQLRIRPAMDGRIEIEMKVDEEHPRWRKPEQGSFWVEAFGGVGLAPALGSGAEASCSEAAACDDASLGLGFMMGARGGYEFPIGLSVEAAGGYLSVTKTMSRRFSFQYDTDGGQPVDGTIDLEDELSFSGGFAGVGLGYRLALAELLELRTNLLLGVVFASWRDNVSGRAAGSDGSADTVWVEGSGTSTSATDLLVMPDLHLGLRFGSFRVSAGLAVGVLVLSGPESALEDVRFDNANPSPCAGVSCARAPDLVKSERSFGTFVLLVPSLAVGYVL